MNRKKLSFTLAAGLATISLCLALLVNPFLQGQVGKVYAQSQVGKVYTYALGHVGHLGGAHPGLQANGPSPHGAPLAYIAANQSPTRR